MVQSVRKIFLNPRFFLSLFISVALIFSNQTNSVSAQTSFLAQGGSNETVGDYEAAIRQEKDLITKLSTIRTDIQKAESTLSASERVVKDADITIKDVEERKLELDEEIRKLNDDLNGKAVDSYISDSLEQKVSTDNSTNPLTQELRAEWILGSVIKQESEIIEELKDARYEKNIIENIKDNAQEERIVAVTTAKAQLKILKEDKAKLEEALAEIQPRIDALKVGRMVKVRGFVVAPSISVNVLDLLDAAEKDGIVLGGSGFRSAEGQIAVRRKNCGTSNYAIYEMPSSQCSPPTARPGSSQHELGLAIDFTCNGGSVTRSTSCFKWLSANAAKYGLKNFPVEPWHWSTTGK